MNNLEEYKKGEFNYTNIVIDEKGNQKISFWKEGEEKKECRVKNLYQKNEKMLNKSLNNKL